MIHSLEVFKLFKLIRTHGKWCVEHKSLCRSLIWVRNPCSLNRLHDQLNFLSLQRTSVALKTNQRNFMTLLSNSNRVIHKTHTGYYALCTQSNFYVFGILDKILITSKIQVRKGTSPSIWLVFTELCISVHVFASIYMKMTFICEHLFQALVV